MISIVIPAHNEEKRIGGTIEELLAFLKRRADWEIVVVEDGSDSTAGIVRAFSRKNRRVRLHHFPKRLGKGGAMTKGLLLAKGDVLMYDADGACAPAEAFKLVSALKDSDVAIGSRYLPRSKAAGITAARFFASRAMNLLVRALFLLPFADTQCGYKAVRKIAAKKIAPALESKGFVWDVEFLYRARKLGLRVSEIPVSWEHVKAGPLESESVVKTAWRMLRDIIRLRFTLWSSRRAS